MEFPYDQILISFGHYYNDLLKIKKFPFWKKVTVRELKLSRGTIQRAYKEMKLYKFEGNIVEYLCYIAMLYLAQVSYNFYLANEDERLELFIDLFPEGDPVILNSVIKIYITDETFLKKAMCTISQDDNIEDRMVYKMLKRSLDSKISDCWHYNQHISKISAS